MYSDDSPVGYRAKVGTHKNNVCGNPLKKCVHLSRRTIHLAARWSGLTAIGRKVESTAVGYVNAFLGCWVGWSWRRGR